MTGYKLSPMRKTSIGRRRFLKQAAATSAAVVAAGPASERAAAQAQAAPAARAVAATSAVEYDPSPTVEVLTTDRPGGDFMVYVMKSLAVEYVAANPGSSFRGLHESLINYGGNRAPEFIT